MKNIFELLLSDGGSFNPDEIVDAASKLYDEASKKSGPGQNRENFTHELATLLWTQAQESKIQESKKSAEELYGLINRWDLSETVEEETEGPRLLFLKRMIVEDLLPVLLEQPPQQEAADEAEDVPLPMLADDTEEELTGASERSSERAPLLETSDDSEPEPEPEPEPEKQRENFITYLLSDYPVAKKLDEKADLIYREALENAGREESGDLVREMLKILKPMFEVELDRDYKPHQEVDARMGRWQVEFGFHLQTDEEQLQRKHCLFVKQVIMNHLFVALRAKQWEEQGIPGGPKEPGFARDSKREEEEEPDKLDSLDEILETLQEEAERDEIHRLEKNLAEGGAHRKKSHEAEQELKIEELKIDCLKYFLHASKDIRKEVAKLKARGDDEVNVGKERTALDLIIDKKNAFSHIYNALTDEFEPSAAKRLQNARVLYNENKDLFDTRRETTESPFLRKLKDFFAKRDYFGLWKPTSAKVGKKIEAATPEVEHKAAYHKRTPR